MMHHVGEIHRSWSKSREHENMHWYGWR